MLCCAMLCYVMLCYVMLTKHEATLRWLIRCKEKRALTSDNIHGVSVRSNTDDHNLFFSYFYHIWLQLGGVRMRSFLCDYFG